MRTIREANISDVGKIVTILSSTYSEEELEGAYLYFVQRVRDTTHFKVLIDQDNSVCALIERVGNYKAQVHIYSTELSRGKYVLNFAKEGFKYLFENTNYTSFITFSPSRLVSLFSISLGFKSLGSMEDSGGVGVEEEMLYASRSNIVSKLKLGDI